MATKKTAKPPKKAAPAKSTLPANSKAKFPRHSVAKAIRIAQAILEQNAGKACSRADAAKFLRLGSPAGPFGVEISSAIKYGFLEQPDAFPPPEAWRNYSICKGEARIQREFP